MLVWVLVMALCLCLSVCLSQVGVLSKGMDGLICVLAWRLLSTSPTLHFKEIRVNGVTSPWNFFLNSGLLNFAKVYHLLNMLGWTTSRRGQDSPWKCQSKWQRTGINGESTSLVWPTLGLRTAKEQNRSSSSVYNHTGQLATADTCIVSVTLWAGWEW